MPYLGWFDLDGAELANTGRVVQHLEPDDPLVDPVCGCYIDVGTDNSWPGLRAFLGQDPYVITNAPWYDPGIPQSKEFAGVWVTKVDGLDATPVQRDVAESIGAGGAAGPHRDKTRGVKFEALVIGCTNAGARFGLDRLQCALRATKVRGGLPLGYLTAHPGGSLVDPASLFRTVTGVVQTKEVTVTDWSGKSQGAAHRQATIWKVDWEMVATNPYAYSAPLVVPVEWVSTSTGGIEWMHAPDCTAPQDCDTDMPVMLNADCVPAQIDIPAMDIPTCGGCLPVCQVETRTWQLPPGPTLCHESAVTVTVHNTGVVPVTVNMHWRPCGSAQVCDRTGWLQVSGLPSGASAIADSVSGRPYTVQAGVTYRPVGIVSTPTGAPWQPTILDRHTCWELVAEHTPGADYHVELAVRDREA